MTSNPASDQKKKQRTLQQNRALHKYFELVAERLNDAGLDMRTLLKPEIDIPWSGESVKEYLWRPIQKIQLQKRSTTELTTREIDLVFDTMNRALGNHGIHEPFPSIQEILLKLEEYEQQKSYRRRRKNRTP